MDHLLSGVLVDNTFWELKLDFQAFVYVDYSTGLILLFDFSTEEKLQCNFGKYRRQTMPLGGKTAVVKV